MRETAFCKSSQVTAGWYVLRQANVVEPDGLLHGYGVLDSGAVGTGLRIVGRKLQRSGSRLRTAGKRAVGTYIHRGIQREPA